MTADPSDLSALSITVPITKSLERLLNRAATDRDLTAEALAQRILREWLLEEGGFAQQNAVSKRRMNGTRADREFTA